MERLRLNMIKEFVKKTRRKNASTIMTVRTIKENNPVVFVTV
jgi:hypothetical protein